MRIGVEEEKSGDPAKLRPCSRLAILLSCARPGVYDTLYKQAQKYKHKYMYVYTNTNPDTNTRWI